MKVGPLLYALVTPSQPDGGYRVGIGWVLGMGLGVGMGVGMGGGYGVWGWGVIGVVCGHPVKLQSL